MAGWHHWLGGHESEWTPGFGDGQGGLACCDSWGRKELDMTEQLNWTELNTPMCNLKKWWTYLQGRSGDAGIGNGLVDMAREAEGGTPWERSIDIHTPPCVRQMAGATAHNPGSAAWCFARTERDGTGAGRREAQGGSDKYRYVCVNIFMCSQLIQVVVQQKPTQL